MNRATNSTNQTTLDKLDAAGETLRKAAENYNDAMQIVANDLARLSEDCRRVGELALKASSLSIAETLKPGAVVPLKEDTGR